MANKNLTPPRQFAGFRPGKTQWASLPTTFFSELLPLLDDLAELKVLLFFFWVLPQLEGEFLYLRRLNFLHDEIFMQGLATVDPQANPEVILDAALERAVKRGALLRAEIPLKDQMEMLYFLNSERGRTAIEQIKAGNWRPGDSDNPIEILPAQPNIYQLYHENFGALTPLIGEELKQLESEFSIAWIEAAMRLAVQREARNLRYVRGILESWRKEGKNDESAGRKEEEDPERYVRGKYADFIEH